MTFSSLAARSIGTPNQSSRGGRAIDHIVLHHMASTGGEGVLEMMRTGRKEVSANYCQMDNGQLVGVVPEESRSWSLSSSEWDGRSITVEAENESTFGWTISAAAMESLAHLVADVCTRYGIPCTRDRVLGHREIYTRHDASYATACPGGMNLDAIVARAQQIMAATPAGNNITPIEQSLTVSEGHETMAEPIYARGDKLDVWYALYLTAEQSNPELREKASGAIYSGRRGPISKGERAIVTAIGYPHPKQKELVTIPQADFDAINKLAHSS